jgi:tyrosine-protein kinase Etk/Wzc
MDQLKLRNRAELRTIPATESEEVQLTQKLLSLKEVSSQVREEYQKARVSEAIQVGEVEIVDLAERPLIPLSRARIPKLLFALLFGTMLGTFVAFVMEHMNTSITKREDLESVLGLAGLAVVPRIGGRLHARIPKPLRVWEFGSKGTNGNGSSKSNLVTMEQTHSPAGEAYRTLRTNLMFSSTVRKLRIVGVTSATPGEGKTTTAANLAVSLAQKGERVLLIDCDLRRPRIHEVFDLEREPGLSSLLVESNKLEDVIRHTDVAGLDVMTSGPIPFNPSELLGGERMRKLIEQMSASYDSLVLDAPPVLVAADASILARITDGLVLVVSAGVTDKDAARAAVDQLRSVGANVIGAVLNDMHAKLPLHGTYAYTYTSYHQT